MSNKNIVHNRQEEVFTAIKSLCEAPGSRGMITLADVRTRTGLKDYSVRYAVEKLRKEARVHVETHPDGYLLLTPSSVAKTMPALAEAPAAKPAAMTEPAGPVVGIPTVEGLARRILEIAKPETLVSVYIHVATGTITFVEKSERVVVMPATPKTPA